MLSLALPRGLLGRYWLRRCVDVGEGVQVTGRVLVHGGGSIRLGDRVCLDARTFPIELLAAEGAELVLGDDVYVGGGTSIEATRMVRVGARSRIGALCKVMDSHFHPLTSHNRHERAPGTFAILEEGCDVGPRVVITAGAHLGPDTIVRAGSVVTRRFPPGVTLAGVPALVQPRH